MKRFILGFFLCILTMSAYALDRARVIYENGIWTSEEAATATKMRIADIIANAGLGKVIREITISSMYNPFGDGAADASKVSKMKLDIYELFNLKCHEEFDAPFFERMLSGDGQYWADSDFCRSPTLHKKLAKAYGAARDARDKLLTKLRASKEPTIIIAHSQGNSIVNLAYGVLVAEEGKNNVDARLRIINLANVSRYSVHRLDMTHAKDAAVNAVPALGFMMEHEHVRCWKKCAFKTVPPSVGYPIALGRLKGADSRDLVTGPIAAIMEREPLIDKGAIVSAVAHGVTGVYLSDLSYKDLETGEIRTYRERFVELVRQAVQGLEQPADTFKSRPQVTLSAPPKQTQPPVPGAAISASRECAENPKERVYPCTMILKNPLGNMPNLSHIFK